MVIRFVFRRIDFQWRISTVLWLMLLWCCIWPNHADDQDYVSTPSVGTPTSATVCNSHTIPLTCDITQSGGIAPVWRVFTTSDTSGSPVATLDPGQNIPPFKYLTIQPGDTVARLEVNASSSINGYHFQCRLYTTPPVDSPGTVSITVIDGVFCQGTVGDISTITTITQTSKSTSGTLTPNGTVLLDCGSQQTFTCSVTGPAAQWTISGFRGISETRESGLSVTNNNPRITTTDTSGVTPSSTITITGFTTADNGGTIQCINLDDNSVQGVANISVGIPSCPKGVDLAHSTLRNNDCDVSLAWQQPPNTSTTVTYCPTSSPNCGNSTTCFNPCTISGLDPGTEYQFTVISNNNCGSSTGCTGNTVTHHVLFCSEISSPDTTPTTVLTPQPTDHTGLIIGVVVPVVLLALIIVIIATILICCFCCKPASDAKNKPPREEQPQDDYADPWPVRDNREMIEGNRITYAAVQFSEEAGGNGKDDVDCKEELDIAGYAEVEHLQV